MSFKTASEGSHRSTPTATFNSLLNVLVLKGVVTTRSWLTEGPLQWS
jgi:hypothetical protein